MPYISRWHLHGRQDTKSLLNVLMARHRHPGSVWRRCAPGRVQHAEEDEAVVGMRRHWWNGFRKLGQAGISPPVLAPLFGAV